MALFDYDICLTSKFVCEKPQHAAPGQKVRYQPMGGIDAWSPCVQVDVRVGTSGVTVDRTAVGQYTGHVPDAPCMLGTQQSQAYLQAVGETSWGWPKLTAVAKACVVGACVAIVVAAVTLGALAALHATVGVSWAEPSSSLYLRLLAFQAPFLGVLLGMTEAYSWADAHATFGQLLSLSRAFERKKHNAPFVNDVNLAQQGAASGNWAVRHASLELKSYEPIAEQKKAG